MNLMALLSLACLLAGTGVALWSYELRQRQRRAMARHMQQLLARGDGAVDEQAALTAMSHGAAVHGVAWGPAWLRHRTTGRQVGGTLAVATLLAVWALWSGWGRVALLGWLLLVAGGAVGAWWRWQRLRQQVRLQLPTFIDTMVRMVLLGHSPQSAFLSAIPVVKEPLHATLAQAAAFSKAGMPVGQALAAASRHWQLDEFALLAAILQVGNRFGGRVDAMLERVAQFMRDREHATRELHALSAEVRLSAWVLSLLPLVVGGLIVSLNARYFMQMWGDPSGRWLLLTAAGLQVSGVLLLYRLARLE